MSNFKEQNLNNKQNILNFDMINTNFNNQYISNDQIIKEEKNQIRAISTLILFQIVLAIIGTICCIYFFSLYFKIKGPSHFSNYKQYYEYKASVVTEFSVMLIIGIAINITVITLGIVTLVKNAKIKLIKINKNFIIICAILAIVSIIPLLGIISLVTFIMSLRCYFKLKKIINEDEN